jgi:Collagen triple helix repeat (20 copies)
VTTRKFVPLSALLVVSLLSAAIPALVAAATTIAFTNFRAAWVSTTAYGAGAVVTYNGASYFCLVGNTGIKPTGAPTSATDWAILDAPGTLVDANGNTAEGQNALSINTGQQNTAFGASVLAKNTTGIDNTASGYAALATNTTGTGNTASGYLALSSNTTGSANTVSGYFALPINTTGGSNTASGAQTLYNNTTGNYNTASGAGALSSNTTGVDNTASGAQTLALNTTGSFNTALGYGAGINLTTGNYNIDIGYESQGVAGESGVVRIGTVGAQSNAYFAGIKSNLTTDPAALPVVVDTVTGQLGTGSLVMGPVGPQGPQGPVGAKGATGATGAMGASGAIGPAGPAGAMGSAGSSGATGAAGPTGPQGPQGVTGAVGPQGTAGTNGTNGIGFVYSPTYVGGTPYAINNVVTEAGSAYVALTNNAGVDPATDVSTSGGNWAIFAAAGAQGAAGPAGTTGSIGATGPMGPQGLSGPQGVAGVPGPAGPVGPAGAAGVAGALGLQGAQGPQGPAGATGAAGPVGAAGAGLPASCASGDVAVFYNNVWTCKSALPRYVVNGDGTVTDNQTGLMWELHTSTCSGEVTCYTNSYTWSINGSGPADGTLFTSFMAGLNGGDY